LGGSSEDWSYVRQAQDTGSVEPCLKIQDEGLRKSCSDSVNFKLSIKENDISFCEAVEDSSMKENCKKNLIFPRALEQKDPGLCDVLEDSASCRDDINLRFAFLDIDISLCNQIAQKDKKDSCLSYVVPLTAVQQDDINLCGTLANKKENCMNYFYYVKSGDNKQLCEKISDKSIQDSCLSDVIISRELMKSMGVLTPLASEYLRPTRIFVNTSDGLVRAVIM